MPDNFDDACNRAARAADDLGQELRRLCDECPTVMEDEFGVPLIATADEN